MFNASVGTGINKRIIIINTYIYRWETNFVFACKLWTYYIPTLRIISVTNKIFK